MGVLRRVCHSARRMNFEACLSLPRNRQEARLVADTFESLARALREWPTESWSAIESTGSSADLFERLVKQTAPYAHDDRSRTQAERSAEAVAGVLRVLWPTPLAGDSPDVNETALTLGAAS